MMNTSLSVSAIDFKDFEKKVYDFVCELGRNIIKDTLQDLDKSLQKSRDKKLFRNKGKRPNSIKTIMGSVEYERDIYKTFDEYGKKYYIYLLDEYLNIETIGHMSSNLIEKIVENATVSSYRKAADNVTSMTGQSLSHTAAWNVVQKLGEKIVEEDEQKVKHLKDGKLNGDKEVKIIFEEADGIWLSMQRDDRPKGKSGKKEMKLAVCYEGWEKRSGKNDSYKVVNKKVMAGFMESDSFKDLRDANLCETYNIDELEYRVLNGDGAKWIRNGHGGEGEIFQLDKFHISRAILRLVEDKKEAKKLINLIHKSQIQEFFTRLEELKFESGGECKVIEKIDQLKKYLEENSEGIIPYQNKIQLPNPPDGLLYRNLGTMESNIYHVLGIRMKDQKMSWSIKGANHLAKILAVKESGKLYETITRVLSSALPERVLEIFEEAIKIAETAVKKISKPKVYPIHRGSIPYGNCKITEGRKAIRNIFNLKQFEEMIYR